MRKIIIGTIAGMLMPFSIAFADVKSDMDAGLPIAQILANAQEAGVGIADAVAQIAAADPSMAAAATAAAISIAPDQAAAISAAAVKAAPKQASAIAQAADVAVVQAQIAGTTGDVDAPATAAGPATPATPATPAAPAGGSGGGGGGVVASPS